MGFIIPYPADVHVPAQVHPATTLLNPIALRRQPTSVTRNVTNVLYKSSSQMQAKSRMQGDGRTELPFSTIINVYANTLFVGTAFSRVFGTRSSIERLSKTMPVSIGDQSLLSD